LIGKDQKRVGAEVQGELFKRRRSEIPDAERVEILQEKLYQKAKQERKYNKRKSQWKCRPYGHNAFESLVSGYGLTDSSKHVISANSLVNADDECYRKAVCGKTARTV
jgi:hypothetical protein